MSDHGEHGERTTAARQQAFNNIFQKAQDQMIEDEITADEEELNAAIEKTKADVLQRQAQRRRIYTAVDDATESEFKSWAHSLFGNAKEK